jgi:hypothetical protein
MLYKVDAATRAIAPVTQTDLASQGLLETRHLEEWFVSSRDILAAR